MSMFLRGSLALVLLSSAACSGREPSTAAEVPGALAPIVSPTATAKPEDDPNANVTALVCSGREAPCSLVRSHDAGRDARKRALSVALFSLGQARPEDGPGEDPQPREEHDPGLHLEANGEQFSKSPVRPCFQYEYWRIVREDGILVEAGKIDEVCHGTTSHLSVSVFENEMHFRRWADGSFPFSRTLRYSLSPFVLRWTSSESSIEGSLKRHESFIRWDELQGATTWTAAACDANGSAIDGEAGRLPDFAYAWLPVIALDPAFVGSGWKTTFLHQCAASIDAAGKHGHVITGEEAGDADDARVKVVAATSGELFVEVIDDTVVGPTARPGGDDHLEVWAAPAAPSWKSLCVDPKDGKGMVAWKVRVTDGKVTPGFGKPQAKSLSVERAADPDGTVRFKLRLPAGLGALTIAYADGDGGGKIERRIATSALVDGRVATLGKLGEAADHVRCTAQNGGLMLELLPEKLPAP